MDMTPSRPRSRMSYPPSLEAGVTSVVYPSERNMSAQKTLETSRMVGESGDDAIDIRGTPPLSDPET